MPNKSIIGLLFVGLFLLAIQTANSTTITRDTDAVHLLVALVHQTPKQGTQLLHQLADVTSPLYGKHLRTHEEIALVWGTPSANEVEGFFKWFKQMDLTRSPPAISVTGARDFLRLDDLFFRDDVSLAKAVKLIEEHPLVEVVYVLQRRSPSPDAVGRGPIIRPAGGRSDANNADSMRGPAAQKQRMGVPATQRGTNPRNLQMVYGTGSYGFAAADLTAYYEWQGQDANASVATAVGMLGNASGSNYVECTVDVEMITTMGLGVPTLSVNNDNNTDAESGFGFGPAMANFIAKLADTDDDKLPRVLSMSLGSLSSYSCQWLCEQAVKKNASLTYDDCLDYAGAQFQVCMFTNKQEDRMNTEFQKLGARGVSLLAATGDGGAHFSFSPFPKTPLGDLLTELSCEHILPTFPGTSSYVTAVGGTSLHILDSVLNTTQTTAWRASGGAFALGPYRLEDFQSDVVASYIREQESQSIFPASNVEFDPKKRAYPDIAALSSDIPLYINGGKTIGGGTSFAAPEAAGVISLINDIRLNNGLPSLGWLNRRLYKVAKEHPGEAFLDIVKGNNACSSTEFCCATGFPATVGWDAASGLGELYWPGLESTSRLID